MTSRFLETEKGPALLISPEMMSAGGFDSTAEVNVSVVDCGLFIKLQDEPQNDEVQAVFEELLVERAEVYRALAEGAS